MKTPKTIRAVTALTQQGQGWDCCNTTDGQSDSEIQLLAKKKNCMGIFRLKSMDASLFFWTTKLI